MSISERLQMVMKMNGMNNATFADEIGVQRSSISHVLAGRNKPSIDFIQKILLTFPKVNADWLITGKKIGRTVESAELDERNSTVTNSEEQSLSTVLKEEEQGAYGGGKSEDSVTNSDSSEDSSREISKILVFYTDGTFEEMLPKN
ncbi:helix-turn-helix domain-containing protein [Brumimicrobium mesophilum]|uniref:helix-turn-helix domain-containing protein n=1 Tax=Brumimicrobium mesophilum TaxID=392717 RepID=UPI00131C5B80|nr:helix-turn-helix transcriptional regulator [Brumimicrobium mesophilum]